MKIKTKIYINSFLSLIIVFAMLIVIHSFSSIIKEELDNDKVADSLLQDTSDLILLINEFLITAQERSERQWEQKYNKIIRVLDLNEHKVYSSNIKEEFVLLKVNYDRLKEENFYYEQLMKLSGSSSDIEKSNNLIEMLSRQLLLNSQNILALTFQISSNADINIRNYNSLTIVLIITFSIIIVLIMIFSSFLTIQRVSSPLTNLVIAVRNVSEGNLSFKLDSHRKNHNEDEVDELREGFNKMTKELNKAFEDLSVELKEKEIAELAMRKLKNYLNNIINSMPSVLVGVDADINVTQWNKKAEQITGISSSIALGKSFSEVYPQMASETEVIIASIKDRNIKHEKKKQRYKDMETIYEDITIYPLVTNGVEDAMIRIDDVTEQVRLEEMMVQTEKMLSVGGLAAGMAHEINNPLAGMMQTANVLTGRLGNLNMPANLNAAKEAGINMESLSTYMESRGILRMIQVIRESGLRASEIVENMLSFARKSDSSVSSHDPDVLLDKILDIAATDYDLKKQYDFKSIEIVREYEKDLPLVQCEGAKIQQVFLNILRNGAEAMNEYQTECKKRGEEVSPPRFILRIAREDETAMLRIEIEDNGPGMTETVRRCVFEPFFTTKPEGVGTGLGLSVSYFIITENHGGTMTVESKPGLGTTFIIKLPLHK
jgi:PAS domain S-box-containing protein